MRWIKELANVNFGIEGLVHAYVNTLTAYHWLPIVADMFGVIPSDE